MKSETTTPETTNEEDFVLKVEVGLVLPLKALNDADHADVVAKSQQLAELLEAHLQAFDVKPEVVHLLNGEAMKRTDFESLKVRAKEQAAHMMQMLQAIAGALPEGAHVMAIGPDGEVMKPEAGEPERSEAGAVDQVDSVEPADDTFRVEPPRTLQ